MNEDSEHIVTFPFRLSYYEAGQELPESERREWAKIVQRFLRTGRA